GFVKFEPIEVRARLQGMGGAQPGRYSLLVESTLKVEGRQAAFPNRWATALAWHYTDLANEPSRIPMLLRGRRGAYMQ
ncbi:hypothetical protein NL393_39815, partial [Klebsiella pneumoniae]|nr:hypothetical protein [Klebsiella pneumoniae]